MSQLVIKGLIPGRRLNLGFNSRYSLFYRSIRPPPPFSSLFFSSFYACLEWSNKKSLTLFTRRKTRLDPYFSSSSPSFPHPYPLLPARRSGGRRLLGWYARRNTTVIALQYPRCRRRRCCYCYSVGL